MDASNRPRKACISCHQRKVRCNLPAGGGRCARCEQQGLDCVLRDAAAASTTPRPSIRHSILHSDCSHRCLLTCRPLDREVLQDLNTRLSTLERSPNANLTSAPSGGRASVASTVNRAVGSLQPPQEQTQLPEYQPSVLEAQEGYSSSSITSIVPVYRGEISPWTYLVNGTAINLGLTSVDDFQATANRLADEDGSINLPGETAYLNLLAEFPELQEEDVFRYIETYADSAPYSIVHWETLKQTTEQLFQTHQASRWGQTACTLLYMAFGCAHLQLSESSVSTQVESGSYFNKAWVSIPQLLMDHDLWAFKALTLMVHYLQASSTPEPCWSLLGTASRMGISLGFNQERGPPKSRFFTPIELEEGRRTMWLCFIMEKTFSVTLGRPSFIIETPIMARPTEYPRYTPIHLARTQQGDDDEIDVWNINQSAKSPGSNPNSASESESVQFLNDMIDLAMRRDSYMKNVNPPIEAIEGFLDELHPNTKYSTGSDLISSKSLRGTISALSHYNAVQIVDSHFRPRLSPSTKSLLAARESLRIMTETQSDGKTMCLWMWLYYAFNSSVILFLFALHTLSPPPFPSSSNPSNPPTRVNHEDILLDLSLISDLQTLCASLAPFSPGAKRIAEITAEMGKAGFELMKRSAKAKKRVRDSEVSAVDPQVSREEGGQGTGDVRAGKSRRIDSVGDGDSMRPEGVDTSAGVVVSVPVGFMWDDWDQWLDDFALS